MIINYLPAAQHPLFIHNIESFDGFNLKSERNYLAEVALLNFVKPGEYMPASLINFFLKQCITKF